MGTKKTKKSVPISREILEAADKIIQKAFACKTNEDFRDTIALDNVFKYAYGKSALEMAGIFLIKDHETDVWKQDILDETGNKKHTIVGSNTRFHYAWKHSLLPPLPPEKAGICDDISPMFIDD